MDKKKILDIRFPKEEQEKSEELIKKLKEKKYQITVKMGGKTRYVYGDDPDILEFVLKAKGAIILKVTKL